MSAGTPEPVLSGACHDCLLHNWLLGELVGPLDRRCRERSRLLDVLSLSDRELMKAVGGSRTRELCRRLSQLGGEELQPVPPLTALCHHDRRYPGTLRGTAAPRALFIDGGGPPRLVELSSRPLVVIHGPRRASDYAEEVTRSIARGLAASGVTVAATVHGGIPASVHEGAMELGAGTIAILGAGARARTGARPRRLAACVSGTGCVLSELPPGCPGRRFGELAAERTAAVIGALFVLVEAAAGSDELATAVIARSDGRIVAAVPGRTTAPLAAGPHALLREGAVLVRGAEDILELLGRSTSPGAPPRPGPSSALGPGFQLLLERVGAGCDSPAELCRGAPDPEAVLTALTRLELMGVLTRGAAGRYLLRADDGPTRWQKRPQSQDPGP